jgi:hypothetical protein
MNRNATNTFHPSSLPSSITAIQTRFYFKETGEFEVVTTAKNHLTSKIVLSSGQLQKTMFFLQNKTVL